MKIALLLVCLGLLNPVLASTALNLSDLEAEVTKQLVNPNATSIAIAVVQDASIIYSKGFGYANPKTKEMATEEHLYRTGSTLKTLVAIAAVALHVHDSWDIHQPISKFDETLPKHLHHLTVHQLLTHTSGLLDRVDDYGDLDKGALARSIKNFPAEDAFLSPGLAFSYSNPGYNLLGYLIEKQTGMPFEQAMNALVFSPLGMKNSTFSTERAKSGKWAPPYHNGSALASNPENRAEWPSGMLYSTVLDYGKLLIALLNEGQVLDNDGINKEVVNLMLRPHVLNEQTATNFGYGYGIMLGHIGEYEAYFHSGGLPGYRANIALFPKSNSGIVIVTNGNGFDRHKIIKALVNVNDQIEKPSVDLRPLTKKEQDAIIGHYIQKTGLPNICVKEQDERLIAQYRHREHPIMIDEQGDYWAIHENGNREKLQFYFDDRSQAIAIAQFVRAFKRHKLEC